LELPGIGSGSGLARGAGGGGQGIADLVHGNDVGVVEVDLKLSELQKRIRALARLSLC
jgi:hypothetical protein